jgi:gliding motility-associated-like protein
MEILSFKVFNRWGNLVFRTNDINEKRDGIYKDKPQNHGTYVYFVKGRNENGEILEYKGNFSLIRQ